MISLNELCVVIKSLIDNSENNIDTLENLYIKGSFTIVSSNLIKEVTSIADADSFISTLAIDGDKVFTSDIAEELQNNPIEWEITLSKSQILKLCGFDKLKTEKNEYLFFDTHFLTEESCDFFNFRNPFQCSNLTEGEDTRIQVFGLEHAVGGDFLSIIPTEFSNKPVSNDNSAIPNEKRIKDTIRILSDQNTFIRPRVFRLSWGDIDNELFRPIHFAYRSTLLACLSNNFNDNEKLGFDGVKHVNFTIFSKYRKKGVRNNSELEKMVTWVYSDEDYSTKKTLIADRISLELPDSFELIKLSKKTITNALEQAKSKYKFIIAERNEDYRKELKDLYSDLRELTSKINEQCEILIKGLITDFLSLSFIFSLTIFSRITLGKSEFLKSEIIEVLFNSIAIYLIISFLLRYWTSNSSIKNSERIFKAWTSKLHNHISSSEIDKIEKEQVIAPIKHFETVCAIIGFIHAFLAILAATYKTSLW